MKRLPKILSLLSFVFCLLAVTPFALSAQDATPTAPVTAEDCEWPTEIEIYATFTALEDVPLDARLSMFAQLPEEVFAETGTCDVTFTTIWVKSESRGNYSVTYFLFRNTAGDVIISRPFTQQENMLHNLLKYKVDGDQLFVVTWQSDGAVFFFQVGTDRRLHVRQEYKWQYLARTAYAMDMLAAAKDKEVPVSYVDVMLAWPDTPGYKPTDEAMLEEWNTQQQATMFNFGDWLCLNNQCDVLMLHFSRVIDGVKVGSYTVFAYRDTQGEFRLSVFTTTNDVNVFPAAWAATTDLGWSVITCAFTTDGNQPMMNTFELRFANGDVTYSSVLSDCRIR